MQMPQSGTLRSRGYAMVRSLLAGIKPPQVATWLGGLVAVFGFVVLAAWVIDNQAFFSSLLPHWQTMKANTALGFVMAGAALWLAATRNIGATGHTAGRICAILTATLGLLTLAQYALQVDLGIDQILLSHHVSRPGNGPAGRMSQGTAFEFALIGAALLASRPAMPRRLRLVSQIAAILVFTLSYVTVLGYGLDVPSLYQFPGLSSVALHTATAMLALSFGTMMLSSDTGVMRLMFSRYAGGDLVRRLLPVALLAPPILGWLRLKGQALGLIDVEVGVALLVAGIALLFAAVAFCQAKAVNALDIDRRRLDGAAIRERGERKLHGVLESAPDAMIIVADDGRIVSVNAQTENLFGYARDELVGQSAEVLIPERFRARHAEYRGRLVSKPNSRRMGAGIELSALRKDGCEVPVEISLAALSSEDGTLVVSAIRDVTERRRQADELRTAKEAAETALARAESASRAKSDFLASMSHELRTPLSCVSGYAQLLSKSGDGLPRPATRYVQSIMKASDQLKDIIDDVLAMAGIETGRLNLSCEAVDCLEVMTEVCRRLGVLAKERHILFTADTSANLPYIFADRARLVQVLFNLGSNAIKYNVEGGWVLLAAYPMDHMVRFVVTDTGRGIPSERHGELFQPFNRLGAEMGPQEGTGLGLAMSHRLVQAMKGVIGFESVVGDGSKFWVDLPVADDIATTSIRDAAMRSTMIDDSGSKILYIEDKIPNVALMRSVIEGLHNMQFTDAQTVKEGIEIARSWKPDLVITDIHLPDGKGFDVLRRLREDPETAHVPVIALTADAMPTNVHNMQRVGFDYIITRPFEIPELVQILHAKLKAA
jgi:PAS domain S-box-containing protein